jgi:hypothetical protein
LREAFIIPSRVDRENILLFARAGKWFPQPSPMGCRAGSASGGSCPTRRRPGFATVRRAAANPRADRAWQPSGPRIAIEAAWSTPGDARRRGRRNPAPATPTDAKLITRRAGFLPLIVPREDAKNAKGHAPVSNLFASFAPSRDPKSFLKANPGPPRKGVE